LVAATGDELEVREYDRMTPLLISSSPLLSYQHIQPGDCVVAFNKADIYSIKKEIEATTPHKCCVVYGQLPPETRTIQVKKKKRRRRKLDGGEEAWWMEGDGRGLMFLWRCG